MDIESLRYFYMIAREGNISTVANQVHLSQSALSQQIKKIENELKIKLLHRNNKGVTLTEEGNTLFKFAENILSTYDKMIAALATSTKDEKEIKIEACHALAHYSLPCTLFKANEFYPDHKYELFSNVSDKIYADVLNMINDVGFTCISDIIENIRKNKELACYKVGISKIVLVTKNEGDYPDSISVDELFKKPLISFTEKNDLSYTCSKIFLTLGCNQNNLRRNTRVDSIESAKTLISNDLGMAFLPYITIKEELYKKQFRIIKIPGFDLEMEINMFHRKDCPAHVHEFVSWFRKNGSKYFC